MQLGQQLLRLARQAGTRERISGGPCMFAAVIPAPDTFSMSLDAQVQLGQQLLRLARQVDALEGRFASAMGHRPPGARAAAADVSERLATLEKSLRSSSAGEVPVHIVVILGFSDET